MNDEELLELLSVLESRELPLLSWGITSGSYTESEILDVITEAVPTAVADDLLDELLERGLIVSTGLAAPIYRTRMADIVRLAVNLRQWFHGGDWRTARTLVSDVRFLSRTRSIPRREQTPQQVSSDLTAALGASWSRSHQEAFETILAGRSIAAFQQRSLERIISRQEGGRGTVVTAGTGSGKTLAFYLPVLTHLLATPRTTSSPRVIAIYPRTELLRDQLRNLLHQSRGLNTPNGPLSVGVLYGSTPYDRADAERQARRGWRRRGDGLISPILQCLEDGCSGDYLWPQSCGDEELLQCDRCGERLHGPQLQFTRKSQLSSPPAILFTTTEMVNRLLGTSSRRLLVGDNRGGPEFLLLDEVHTYSGTHGAQVANLLRRWRSGFATPPHIVGLSATLSDPAGFFSTLTGLPPNQVAAIGPQPSEMRPIGREYFLALRGDPASQTSLLSTTIQTAMLMRRMLDISPGVPSHRAFGSKVFAFTDDLDVTNRLHSQLEDAEGWRPGGVNRKPQGSLATLRAAGGPDAQLREQAGQVWSFAEQNGTLQHQVRVARTTSRDSGVDAGADIVVATASLEVGFDDPHVGAVLQHKAPRDAAQFLQRRGRAGRDPIMRPWTVAILSDFGRDRLAFQSYEALFEPVVRAAPLPVHNRVILKMQATRHLADQLERVTNLPKSAQDQRTLAPRLRRALHEILTDAGIARLSRQLRWALALDEEEVRAILWDHPRGLITAVVPTLLRAVEALERGRSIDANPLREFLPPSLFAALYTPEVQLQLPGTNSPDEGEPVATAMRQFAPGRVSYRYALNGRRDRLWTEPPSTTGANVFELRAVATDVFDLESPPDAPHARIVQLTVLRLQSPPSATSDSSYGRWLWKTAFAHDGDPLLLDVPAKSTWSQAIPAFAAHTHRYRSPLRVWRTSSEVEVERNDPQQPVRTNHAVTLDGEDVSVGFVLDVDGVVAQVALLTELPTDPQVVRALRVSRLEFHAQNDVELISLVPSHFTREWLYQVLLSTLVTASHGQALQQVLHGHTDQQLRDAMIDAAQRVFGADPNSPLAAPGLVQDLVATLQEPLVLKRLRVLSESLWTEPDVNWLGWMQLKYLSTLGAAMVQGVQALCPDVDTGTLRMDINPNDPTGHGIVRLSEDEPGGIGVVETFVERYVEDPRAYWALVAASLGPSDTERVDSTLSTLLQSFGTGDLAENVARIRRAPNLVELTEAWNDLRVAMFNAGMPNDPSVTSALGTRILRPGSTDRVDALAMRLIQMWDALEESLGIEIELRVFAFVAANDAEIQRDLQAVTQQVVSSSTTEIGQIAGLLWPRGSRIRASALETYNPYVNNESTERLLLRSLLTRPNQAVRMDDPQWRENVDAQLRVNGMAVLRAADEQQAAEAIADLLTQPTDVEVLEFHPRVVGIHRDASELLLALELREAHQ